MIKRLFYTGLLLALFMLNSCATGYKTVEPETLKYVSRDIQNDVILEYKYNLLRKKYEKKEEKKGIQVAAIKITNNSDRDIMFGRDVTLVYEDDTAVTLRENTEVFRILKQKGAYHLFYLFFTPMNLYTTNSSGDETSSTPIGLVVGPGLAATNMIIAGSANKKFEEELMMYDINGITIQKGETKYGLIGIEADSFDALKLRFK